MAATKTTKKTTKKSSKKTSSKTTGNKKLVIVESPTKAKTIRKFLPSEFIVEASMGHIRDLPQSATEIPAAVKKEEWAKLGVNIEQDFEPLYVVPKGKSKIIRELKKKLKECSAIYLATDEDREGESISWHLIELLQPKVPVYRMVFHEITRKAIQASLEHTREIDMRLVQAQEARRILDRIYGYTLSPLLWKKICYGLSAGRVQSSGLRLLAERERERMLFKSSQYWDIHADVFKTNEGEKKAFKARLTHVNGKKVANGKDFDEVTGNLKKDANVVVLPEKEAVQLAKSLESQTWKVQDIKEKASTSRPAIPFITSTLQQEGNRKLGMSARAVMQTAQRLYEQGFITYMRTDSPNLSNEAIAAARHDIETYYGKQYLSPEPRQFKSKSKGAQEAHEAIRPAGAEFVKPSDSKLSGKELSLYELIWKRTLACQMADAQKSTMTVNIEVDGNSFVATGTRIVFPGFLRVYVEGSDNPDAALENKEVILPKLEKGEVVSTKEISPLAHETRPPARYTEASLVQKLEKEGIGRPSTYATIIGTILERRYARLQGKALVPSFTGLAVAQLLMKYFADLVDYAFTSDMEAQLDMIAEGEAESITYLKKFTLGKKGLLEKVKSNEKKIKPDEARTVELTKDFSHLEIKVGRYGPYIIAAKDGKEEIHASIPEDIPPADLKVETVSEIIEEQKNGPTPIGQDPETGLNVYCLTGRYGAYLQLGEKTDDGPKPKRSSLPKTLTPKTVTLEEALRLLSLPRELGMHPEKKLPVVANLGRFGPYVVCDEDFRSLKKDDNVYEVTLERALELLAEEKRTRRGSTLLADFGKHPKKNKKMAIYDGKYGPYIKFGTKNIALPDEYKDVDKAKALKAEKVTEIIDANLSK